MSTLLPRFSGASTELELLRSPEIGEVSEQISIKKSDMSEVQELDSNLEPIQAKPCTFRDQLFFELGLQAIKSSGAVLNDSLGRMITLSSAMIGGGFVAAKGEVIPFWTAFVAIVCFASALISSLLGIKPERNIIDISDPDYIESLETETRARKTDHLNFAYFLFTLGLIISIIGLLIFKIA